MSFYATANPQDQYRQDYVTTASPVDLVIMLYEGCIKQLKLAKIHLESSEPAKVSECCEKAEEIILELVRSLNLSIPISENLLELYQFMVDEIVRADLAKDAEPITPVIEMLTSLCEAWKETKACVEGSTYVEESE